MSLREAALQGMHALLHVDADMGERLEAAKAIALELGHPWPPYEADPECALSEADIQQVECPFHASGNQGHCNFCEDQ